MRALQTSPQLTRTDATMVMPTHILLQGSRRSTPSNVERSRMFIILLRRSHQSPRDRIKSNLLSSKQAILAATLKRVVATVCLRLRMRSTLAKSMIWCSTDQFQLSLFLQCRPASSPSLRLLSRGCRRTCQWCSQLTPQLQGNSWLELIRAKATSTCLTFSACTC